jgi:hypothetical protein
MTRPLQMRLLYVVRCPRKRYGNLLSSPHRTAAAVIEMQVGQDYIGDIIQRIAPRR